MNKVELIGIYGEDLTHGCSAWTSTGRDLTPERLARLSELLDMLAKNGHHTPFEKSTLHFLVTCDLASHIHLLKHRVGVSINSESPRYKELKEDKFYIPDDWPDFVKQLVYDNLKDSYILYHSLIETLVNTYGFSRQRAKESARYVLPYANQLTMDISFNFRSFMHFQKLRNDSHAQKEIRDIAQSMLSLVRGTGKFDASLKAFGY